MNYNMVDEISEIHYWHIKDIIDQSRKEYGASIIKMDRDREKNERIALTKEKYIDFIKRKIYDR